MKNFASILLITLFSFVFSQSSDSIEFRKVTGKILESNGEAMVDAYVYIETTDIGTYTDINGNFCFALPKDREVLLIVENFFEPVNIKVKPNIDHLVLRYKRIRRTSNKVRKLFLKKRKTTIMRT